MLFHVNLGKDVGYLTIFANDEGYSLCEESSDSEHAVGFGDFFVFVAEDGEWQTVFFGEFGM